MRVYAPKFLDDDGFQRVSASLRDRTLSIEEANSALNGCGSYARMPLLISLWPWHLEDPYEWLRLLSSHWPGMDNVGLYYAELANTPFFDFINHPALYRDMIMTSEEKKAWNSLPETVTIWRGCHEVNKRGLSWSLDRDIAEQFPFLWRYSREGQPLLVRAEVKRDNIAMIKLDRNESEIVARDYKIKEINPAIMRPDEREAA